MKLQSHLKLPHGRCREPSETIQLLTPLLAAWDPWLHEEKVSDELHWAVLTIDGLDFRAMGKGTEAEQARAGALAEAAEWLLARELVDLPGYCCSHQEDLERPQIALEQLLHHVAGATPPVLENLKNLDAAQHWVEGFSLLDHRPVLVPAAYVQQISGPNGKAAGNVLEEAIVHGALEVFERRAHITVLRQRLVMPTYDPQSISDPLLRRHFRFCDERGIRWTLKDFSFGGVLPCVGVYFEDPQVPEEFQFRRFLKVGASFDPVTALTRCFTEYVQGRRADEFIDGSPSAQEHLLRHDFRQLRSESVGCDNFLPAFMFGFVPTREADYLTQGERVAFPSGAMSPDIREDVDAACRVCEALGKDLVVVDWSQPGTNFHVAQVIVPGYSDALPYHPANSPVLLRTVTRPDVLHGFGRPVES